MGKKVFQISSNIFSIGGWIWCSAFILMALMNLSWVVHEKTRYLPYEKLPQDLKVIVQEYEKKATAKGLNVWGIKNMVFVLYEDPRVSHGGFGYQSLPGFVGFRYQKNMPYYVKKKKVWHEFGHIFLGYGHETDCDHIMNYETQMNSQNMKELEESYFDHEVDYFSYKTISFTVIDHTKNLYFKIISFLGIH